MIAINSSRSLDNQQIVTFHCGNLLLGLEISRVQEINRQTDVMTISEAPDPVHGVINLRGEVITVIDLRTVLGLSANPQEGMARNVVVRSNGERIGLMADGISDIIDVSARQIELTPSNIDGIESRYFAGITTANGNLVVILNLDEIMEVD